MDTSVLPKYIMIKNHLKMVLIKGTIAFGEKLPSEYALMEKFQVSRHTIRQALKELENEGLIYKEQGKGTFSKYVEAQMQKNMVAVVITYASDYILPHIIAGIEQVLSKKGYPMLLYITNSYKEKERQCLNSALEHGVTGIIIDPTQSAIENENYRIFNQLKEQGIKTVFMNAAYSDTDSAVMVDDEKGTYLATEYLLKLGHTRIAGIFKTDDLQGLARKAGYLNALKKTRVVADEDIIGEYDSFTKYDYPHTFTIKVLQAKKPPTAIVCYNDEIATMVIARASELGLKVPDHLSVTGFDDSALAAMNANNLTSIAHPKKAMGETAARYLVDMLDGKETNPRKIYEPTLVVRGSCKKL